MFVHCGLPCGSPKVVAPVDPLDSEVPVEEVSAPVVPVEEVSAPVVVASVPDDVPVVSQPVPVVLSASVVSDELVGSTEAESPQPVVVSVLVPSEKVVVAEVAPVVVSSADDELGQGFDDESLVGPVPVASVVAPSEGGSSARSHPQLAVTSASTGSILELNTA